MISQDILAAARALQQAQQHETEAEQALMTAAMRSNIHDYTCADAAHRQAVNAVECAQDRLVNTVMREVERYDAEALQNALTETQEMPAVRVSE